MCGTKISKPHTHFAAFKDLKMKEKNCCVNSGQEEKLHSMKRRLEGGTESVTDSRFLNTKHTETFKIYLALLLTQTLTRLIILRYLIKVSIAAPSNGC
jgi:hypothetical protein